MEKIRFCHVIDGANLNPLLYNSIKFSDKSVFDYTVICLGTTGPLQQQMEELGVRFIAYGNSSRKKAFRNWRWLYRYFRKDETKIVQTHLFDSSLIGLSAAKLAGVPVRIFTGHHSHEVPLHGHILLTFVDGINGRLLANHCIAPSTDMKDIFIRHQKIPARKIEVIPHGFDIGDLQTNSGKAHIVRKELGIDGRIVFGAAGRLFWVKDFERLIDAFAAFASNKENIVLLIAGDGSDREKLQQHISSLRMDNKIMLTGRRNDMPAFMASIDVFVHSAIAESFGMVFIEAFALGKPVISTLVGVAPDIISDGENGLLVPVKDTAAMTAAFEKMFMEREQWPAIGERNRQIAAEYDVRKTQMLCDTYYIKWLIKQ